jgi:hypothetical protein
LTNGYIYGQTYGLKEGRLERKADIQTDADVTKQTDRQMFRHIVISIRGLIKLGLKEIDEITIYSFPTRFRFPPIQSEI